MGVPDNATAIISMQHLTIGSPKAKTQRILNNPNSIVIATAKDQAVVEFSNQIKYEHHQQWRSKGKIKNTRNFHTEMAPISQLVDMAFVDSSKHIQRYFKYDVGGAKTSGGKSEVNRAAHPQQHATVTSQHRLSLMISQQRLSMMTSQHIIQWHCREAHSHTATKNGMKKKKERQKKRKH